MAGSPIIQELRKFSGLRESKGPGVREGGEEVGVALGIWGTARVDSHPTYPTYPQE